MGLGKRQLQEFIDYLENQVTIYFMKPDKEERKAVFYCIVGLMEAGERFGVFKCENGIPSPRWRIENKVNNFFESAYLDSSTSKDPGKVQYETSQRFHLFLAYHMTPTVRKKLDI